MNILIIILSIIGLLKLVSLFILLLLHIYYRYKGNSIVEAHRDSNFYLTNEFYIIPTISLCKTGEYFSIEFYWINLRYYESNSIELEK